MVVGDNVQVIGRDGLVLCDAKSFSLSHGSFCLVSGAAGSGKTLLCASIAGFSRQWAPILSFAGELTWRGSSLWEPFHRPGVVYTPESPWAGLSGIASQVAGEILLACQARGMPTQDAQDRLHQLAGRLGIEGLLARDIMTLSGGETQKVVFAASAILHPELWVLDQPFSDMDDGSRASMLRLLNEATQRGTIVVLADRSRPEYSTALTHHIDLPGPNTPPTFSLFEDSWQSPPRSTTLPTSPPANVIAMASGISFSYNSRSTLLDNVSFALHPGELLLLTGPNGSGKSTLLKLLLGLLRPTRGTMSVCGERPDLAGLRRLSRHVAYLAQNVDLQLCTARTLDEISLGLDPKLKARKEIALHALAHLGIPPSAHPFDLSRSVRQRLLLGAILLKGSALALLDEPTRFQDDEGLESIVLALRAYLRSGGSAIVVTHDDRAISSLRQYGALVLEQSPD